MVTVFEFCGHVEQVVRPVVNRAMGPYTMAKVHLAGDCAAGNVDHHHFTAVGAWLTNARAPIDRHVRGEPIRKGGYLVAGDASLRHGGQLFGSHRVNDAKVAVTLVGGHKKRLYRGSSIGGRIGHKKGQRQDQADRKKRKVQGFWRIHGGSIIFPKALPGATR